MQDMFHQSTPGDGKKQPQGSELPPSHAIPQLSQGSTPSPASKPTAPYRVSAAGEERTKAPNKGLDEPGKAADSDCDHLTGHLRFLDKYADVIQLLYEAPYGLSEDELLASIALVSDQPRPEQVRDRMVGEVIISGALSNQSQYSLTFSLRKLLDQATGMNTHGLEQVRDVALEFYGGDKTAVEQFLNRSHLMLENRTPLIVALEGRDGAHQVMKVLEVAAHVPR